MFRFLRALIILSAVTIAVFTILGAIDFAYSPYSGIKHQNLIIQKVEEGGPNRELKLEPGDRILAVDGISPRNINHFKYLVNSNKALLPQKYRLARNDSIFEVTVRYTAQPQSRISLKVAFTIVAFTFLIVGLVVIVKRFDILGILFSVICSIFAILITTRPVTSYPIFHIAGELLQDFMFISLPAFFFHFFLIFPGREIAEQSYRKKAIRVLYIPPVIFYAASCSIAVWRFYTYSAPQIIRQIESLIAAYWFAYIIASLVAFIRTYISSDSFQRIKFRIVIIGVILGIIPISTVMLIKQFSPTMELPYENFSVVFLSFISISFAYAILRHGAFDLGGVLRKVLVYTILSIFIVAAYFLLTTYLGAQLEKLLRINARAATIAVLVLLAILFSPARKGAQRVVDLIFARKEKQYMNSVLGFSRKIQFCLSHDEIARLVADEVLRIIEPESVHIFFKSDKHSFSHVLSIPDERKIPFTSFSASNSIVKLMETKMAPVMIDYYDSLWIKNNLDRISREIILLSNVSVAVPFSEQNEMLGFLLMGPKKSKKVYSHMDSEILELIGERSAIALKNIHLYRDSLEKEKLDKELQLASEIQKRLLPEAPPSLRRSEVAGRIETSREVGGDFFDFIRFGENEIAVAVADVSGKGIPAALLMTTLKATLRSEASEHKTTAEVVSNLNSALYDISDTTKFATFFYAVYNDETGILKYCNAGSFPPFMIRADGKVDRLHRGGTVIGIERDLEFIEGIIKLKKGDLVAIYTDGIIDQENEKGEPFGERRLVDFLRDNSNLSIDILIDKLFATLFAYGNNLFKDDMSVVFIRRID